VQSILHQRKHPQQGYRACLGILRLGKEFGESRLEAACDRAIAIGALSYRSLKSILAHGLDRKPVTAPAQTCLPLEHANVRGPNYYH
jgi:transposase